AEVREESLIDQDRAVPAVGDLLEQVFHRGWPPRYPGGESRGEIMLAESEGFEPPIPLRVLLISNQVPSAARPALRIGRGSNTTLAERVGFEPTIRCRIHPFQACAFGRSATPPW